jgi:hypothetical protein
VQPGRFGTLARFLCALAPVSRQGLSLIALQAAKDFCRKRPAPRCVAGKVDKKLRKGPSLALDQLGGAGDLSWMRGNVVSFVKLLVKLANQSRGLSRDDINRRALG